MTQDRSALKLAPVADNDPAPATMPHPPANMEKLAYAAMMSADGYTLRPLRMNLLLVEDYEPNAVMAAAFLERLGYNCDIAPNGQAALGKLQTGHYDLILMDVQMPGMDGVETTMRFRQMEMDSDKDPTPVLAMTAYSMEHDKSKCRAAGMNDFIPKPFSPAELAKKVVKHIRKPPEKPDEPLMS